MQQRMPAGSGRGQPVGVPAAGERRTSGGKDGRGSPESGGLESRLSSASRRSGGSARLGESSHSGGPEDRAGEPAEPQAGFRGPQVCSLVGITYRQLDYWARTGLLRPSVADARGSGTQRLYSYHDLLELKVVKQLLDAGVSLQRARRAIDCLRIDLGADVGAASLVLAGSGSVLARSDGEVVDLLRGGQGVLNIVPLGGVVDELDAAIHRLEPTGPPVPSGHSPRAGDDLGTVTSGQVSSAAAVGAAVAPALPERPRRR